MQFCRRVCRMVAGEREMCKIQQVQVCKKVKLYLIFARFRIKIRLSVNHLYWYMLSFSFYVKFQHWSSWKIPMWYFPTWSFLIHHVKIILVFNLPYDVMKQLIYLWSIWSNNCLFFRIFSKFIVLWSFYLYDENKLCHSDLPVIKPVRV